MKHFFGKISFQNKIIIIFVTTVLLLLGISNIALYSYASVTMKEKTQDYLQNVASVTMSKVEMSERAYLSETKSVPFFRSGFSWYYVIGTGSAGFLQHYKRYFQCSG